MRYARTTGRTSARYVDTNSSNRGGSGLMAGLAATRREPIHKAQAKASVFMPEVIGPRVLRLRAFEGSHDRS